MRRLCSDVDVYHYLLFEDFSCRYCASSRMEGARIARYVRENQRSLVLLQRISDIMIFETLPFPRERQRSKSQSPDSYRLPSSKGGSRELGAEIECWICKFLPLFMKRAVRRSDCSKPGRGARCFNLRTTSYIAMTLRTLPAVTGNVEHCHCSSADQPRSVLHVTLLRP